MMRFAVVLLGLALIAAFFGFAGVVDYSGTQFLSVILLVLAVLSFLGGVFRSAFKNSSA